MLETVICGASGLVGGALARRLGQAGHPYSVVGRSKDKLLAAFPGATRRLSWSEFEEDSAERIGTVVNLAGASVMARRWTSAYKQVMTDSRLKSTALCAAVCSRQPGMRLLSASSVHAYGIYAGDHEAFTEFDRGRRSGSSYLQGLIDAWEEAARPAARAGCSLSCLRIGVVLSERGGALPAMARAFRAYVGGRQGTGRQVVSWISLDDLASVIGFLIEHPELTGPINAVAPNPCTNSELARAVGRSLGRPAALPAPGFALRAIMGQGGFELVLRGQRVAPRRLSEAGFEFRDHDVRSCLARLLS